MSRMVNLIYDLDGTLINSSAGILAAVGKILEENNMTPACQLSANLIGPPLKEMLSVVAGSEDSVLIDSLAGQFMKAYDSYGYLETTCFDGVERMLGELYKQGYPLYIATNKREHPTLKILELLGWNEYFNQVCALDQFPDLAGKGALLEWMIVDLGLSPQNTIYIGDRNADHQAAHQAKLGYLMAKWGYETEGDDCQYCLETPDQLLQLAEEGGKLLDFSDRERI